MLSFHLSKKRSFVITRRACPCYDEEQRTSFHYRSLLPHGATEKFSPKLASQAHRQCVPTFLLPLRNVNLMLKCDMSEKTTCKSPHSTLALITKPTNPLLPQPTTFLVASTTFKVQRVKEKMYPSITNRGGGLWHNCSGSCSSRSHHCTNEKSMKVAVAATATVFEITSHSLLVHHSQVKRAST